MDGSLRGSRDVVCDPFCTPLDTSDRMAFKPGQLYWGQVVYPCTEHLILKMENYDPRDERKTTFSLKPYKTGDENHYPVKELDLHEGELYHVFRGKKRPVVILGFVESDWLTDRDPQKIYICAPIFSFKNNHSQEYIVQAQAFCVPNLFYLPPESDGCDYESAVRFELIQPIMKGTLQPYKSVGGKPVTLTTEAYGLLLSHLVKYLTGEMFDKEAAELISIYQETLLEEWEKDKAKAIGSP